MLPELIPVRAFFGISEHVSDYALVYLGYTWLLSEWEYEEPHPC